jgi:uncharacterized membrane protein YgcG
MVVNNVFSFQEGLTSGERTAMLTNSVGKEESTYVNDIVAAKAGPKKGIEGMIVKIDERGNLHVSYNINIPEQQFVVGENVMPKRDYSAVMGKIVSVSDNKSVSVSFNSETPIVYSQSDLLMYYTPNEVMVVRSTTYYTPAIGDKVMAKTGSKAWIEGEVTDINPSGDVFVKYNTTIEKQRFMMGDRVAVSSGTNSRRVGTVSRLSGTNDVTVTYDTGDPITYKQNELQMFYLKSQVQLVSEVEDTSYDSTPVDSEGGYDPDNLDTVYNENSENKNYYSYSYDSNGKLIYTPITWSSGKSGGTSGSSGSGSSGSGSSGSSGSGSSGSSGSSESSRGTYASIDDSVILGENSILADYTSPPDSATSVDANVDTKAPVADADTLNKIYQLLNSLIERNHCTVSTYGCCKDNITAKKDVPGSNCSESTSVGLSDDVKKYIDTAVSEKTFTFTPNNSSLLQTSLPSPPTNQLSTQASYTNTVFLAPPHGNYMYPGRCPNPADCNTPTYSNVNSDKLPLPLVADFSQFGK